MRAENVIGFTLKEARNMLNDAGEKIASVKLTSPPKAELTDIDDYCRVIKAIDKVKKVSNLLFVNPSNTRGVLKFRP